MCVCVCVCVCVCLSLCVFKFVCVCVCVCVWVVSSLVCLRRRCRKGGAGLPLFDTSVGWKSIAFVALASKCAICVLFWGFLIR